MNRTIKFRAWDKELDKMWEVVNLNWNGGYVEMHYPKGGSSGPFKDFELMQFTWLHDKNWKEIYEGDLVEGEVLSGFWSPQKSRWYDHWPEEVVFSEERAGFYPFTLSSYWSHDEEALDPEHCEVVGNIYENPELIND